MYKTLFHNHIFLFLIIVPELGNIAIIDLDRFDIAHEVTEVIGDLNRYTALSFISLIGNE